MIITLERGAEPETIRRALVALGLWVERFEGGDRVVFKVEPHSRSVDREAILAIRGVEAVATPKAAHPLVDAMPRVVALRDLSLGTGCPPVFMAGPCSVESEPQIRGIASRLAKAGVRVLRGGAFKPRTSPYAFQGHGEVALGWLRKAADEHGMAVVTEVMSEKDASVVAEHSDLLQIGSRNMHNYALLKAVSKHGRPVLLKRGMAATVEEWLSSAEYCLVHGAPGVVFCERGIRSFDATTRNLLDLGAVALLSGVHQLPVVVDPSHAVGRRDLIPALSRASLAAGASGLMIETHPEPGVALSDGPQALLPDELASLVESLTKEEGRHVR